LDDKEEMQRGAATNYEALVALDKMDLVPNVEAFECCVCLTAFNPGEGAMLRECLHTFCRPCLAHTAQFSEEVEVHCPFRNDQYVCDAILQEREVRAVR
jgi:RanBP-type and C3HC4-type zinc finger-containing protein 1